MTSKYFSSTYRLSSQSTNTVNSTTPLYTGPSQEPQKDYAAILGTLQSRYGTGGNIPSPKQTSSIKLVDNLSTISESSLTSSRIEVASDPINSAVSGSSTRTEGQIKGKNVAVSMGRFSFLKLLFKGKKEKK